MAVTRDRYILEVETRGAQSALAGLSTAFKGIGIAAAAAALAKFGQEIVRASAQMQNFQNSLRLITDSQQELNDTMALLTRTAQANRASFGDTVDLFTKLTLATEDMGKSQEEVIQVVTNFQRALAISGADANTAAGAIRQFGQAMASGTVRGDEFNSIVEALGPALSIMARESGIGVGRLRELSREGKLTAEVFFEMVRSSQALGTAFNSTVPTIDQMETALSDAFDRALVKIGELSGATGLYQQSLESLTRAFDRISGADTIANLDLADIMAQTEQGTINVNQALTELNLRLNEAKTAGFFPILIETEEIRNLNELISRLEELKTRQEAAAEAARVEAEAVREQQAALDAVLAPHQRFIDQAQKFADTDYRTELEKANQRVIDAEIVIEQLRLAFERSNGQVENFAQLLRGAQNELQAAQTRVSELTTAANELARSDFDKFYDAVIERSRETVQNFEFTQQAIVRLNEEFAAGRISLDVYAHAMEQLDERFENDRRKAEELRQTLEALRNETDNAIAGVDARIRQAQEAAELSGLEGLERQLRSIELEERRLADAARARIMAQSEGVDQSTIEAELARIDEAMQRGIEQRQSAARTVEENTARIEAAQKRQREAVELSQRSFADGWREAFEEYERGARVSGETGLRVFGQVTRGLEDLIVNFAKTGKFEWKEFTASIVEELLRQNVRQVIASTLSGGDPRALQNLISQLPGAAGNPEAQQFGREIGALLQQMGTVGEVGASASNPMYVQMVNADIFQGASPVGLPSVTPRVLPNTITSPGGGAQVVNYNINATDAASFRAMIAKEPEFIHAVAMAGASTLPGGRGRFV